ncbi:MAG: hypothetical protein M5R36_02830 [Deltaproteobacteria bacterium]|nr:hypothetical protein [Deltaproteobacteria bacterium]
MSTNTTASGEYDNPQPGWWSWIFIACIVFSLGYFVYYHAGGPGKSEVEIYEISMRELEERKAELAKSRVVEAVRGKHYRLQKRSGGDGGGEEGI